MYIIIKLSEIVNKCNSWEEFCKDYNFDITIINGEDKDVSMSDEVSMSEEDAIKYGIIKV